MICLLLFYLFVKKVLKPVWLWGLRRWTAVPWIQRSNPVGGCWFFCSLLFFQDCFWLFWGKFLDFASNISELYCKVTDKFREHYWYKLGTLVAQKFSGTFLNFSNSAVKSQSLKKFKKSLNFWNCFQDKSMYNTPMLSRALNNKTSK